MMPPSTPVGEQPMQGRLGPPPAPARDAERAAGPTDDRSGPLPPRPGLTLAPLLAVSIESALLLIALVPQSFWLAHHRPSGGPIPAALSPIVAGLFYVLPALIGALCRRWPAAVVLATLPAWLDTGAFAVAAAKRVGPFYLAQQEHAVGTVGTIELFAALGVFGWLARTAAVQLPARARREA